jgi:hypothetical protein
MTPKEALQELLSKKTRDNELEKIITGGNEAVVAWDYICKCLRTPWPEAEPLLAKDTYWAVAYAIDFLKAPFEMAHTKIFEKSIYNQIMVNKYKHFLNEIYYDYSEWII